jgi:hypothetical protein
MRRSMVYAAIPSVWGLVALLMSCESQRYPCEEEAARKLGRAAYLSAPIFESRTIPPPERIDSFVGRNGSFFRSGGPSIRCAKQLSARLFEAGTKAYDPDAYAARMGGGPDELKPDVARSINSGAVQLVQIASELRWLSDVLPPMAEGNSQPYWTTCQGSPGRCEARNYVLKIFDMLAQDPDQAFSVQLTREQFMQAASTTEEAMVMLAMMLR